MEAGDGGVDLRVKRRSVLNAGEGEGREGGEKVREKRIRTKQGKSFTNRLSNPLFRPPAYFLMFLPILELAFLPAVRRPPASRAPRHCLLPAYVAFYV